MATFLESPRFPDNIAFGAVVGPTYSTVVVTAYSGRENRVVAWSQSKINFEVGLRALGASDTASLDAFFRAVKGRGYGFRIKDWTDFVCAAAQGVLVAQSTVGVYQLGKAYQNGSFTETRLIQKPVTGTVSVYRNGTLLSSGVSVDYTTGLVTLSSFASANVTGVTVGSSTVITLASALSGLSVGGLLYLSGLTGADAALLNGQQFTVSAISGAQYTLSVNTTGKTITAAGTGAEYVQPTDVMSWAGQFDVPARFDVDVMKKQIVDRNGSNGDLLVEWGSIPIVEVRL